MNLKRRWWLKWSKYVLFTVIWFYIKDKKIYLHFLQCVIIFHQMYYCLSFIGIFSFFHNWKPFEVVSCALSSCQGTQKGGSFLHSSLQQVFSRGSIRKPVGSSPLPQQLVLEMFLWSYCCSLAKPHFNHSLTCMQWVCVSKNTQLSSWLQVSQGKLCLLLIVTMKYVGISYWH